MEIIQFIIFLIFSIILISIVAYVESQSKAEQLFYDEHHNLYKTAIILFVGLFIILGLIRITSEDLFYSTPSIIILFVVRIIIASYVSNKANELERNRFLWWFLGFLEFHVALFVLSLSKKLLSLDKKTKLQVIELNKSTNTKLNAINKSTKDGIISENEKSQKTTIIRQAYLTELREINNETSINATNSKLEFAFKNGVITEEEYLKKKEAI